MPKADRNGKPQTGCLILGGISLNILRGGGGGRGDGVYVKEGRASRASWWAVGRTVYTWTRGEPPLNSQDPSHPRHGCATLEPPEVLAGFLSSPLGTGTLEVSAGAYLGTGSCELPPLPPPRPKAARSCAAAQSGLQGENSRRSRLRPTKRRR